jgi:hypothetical protein
VDKKQDEFKVKVDTKYGKYVKLGIAVVAPPLVYSLQVQHK